MTLQDSSSYDECEVLDSDECGYSYDHQLRLLDERDGDTVWQCINCGAEVLEESMR